MSFDLIKEVFRESHRALRSTATGGVPAAPRFRAMCAIAGCHYHEGVFNISALATMILIRFRSFLPTKKGAP